MIINRLNIKGFSKLKDTEIELCPELNIIYGENETGKSTMQTFIKAMFYGLKGGRGKDGLSSPVRRYKPWNGESYGGYMEYTLSNGETYRVVRNFATNSISISDSLSKDITHNFSFSGRNKNVKFAEEHLGLSELCFEKTAFMGQMGVQVDNEGKDEIINRLINASETGYEDVSFKKAERALKEAILSYTGTEKTSTRPLDKVNKRLTELESLYKDIKSKKENIREIEGSITRKRKLLEEYKKQEDFISEAGGIIRIFKKLNELIKINNELAEIDDRITLLENENRNSIIRIGTLEKIYGFEMDDVENSLSMDGVNGDGEVTNDKKINVNYDFKLEEITENSSIEEVVLSIKDEVNNLREEQIKSKNHRTILQTEMNSIKNKNKVLVVLITIACFLAIGFGGFSIASIGEFKLIPRLLVKQIYISLSAGISILTLFISVLLLCFRIRSKDRYSGLRKRWYILDANINQLKEKLDSRNTELNRILEKFGASDLKEFFKIKTYLEEEKIKLEEFKNLKIRVSELQRELNFNYKKASLLVKASIIRKKDLKTEIYRITEEINSYKQQLRQIVDSSKFFNNIKIQENVHANDCYYNYAGIRDYFHGYSYLHNHDCTFDSGFALDCSFMGEHEYEFESQFKDLKSSVFLLLTDKNRLLPTDKSKLLPIDKNRLLPIDKNEGAENARVKNPSSSTLDEDSWEYSQDRGEGRVQTVETLDITAKTEQDLETYAQNIRERLYSVALDLKEDETIINTQDYDEEQLQDITEEIERLETEKKKLENIQYSLNKALEIMSEVSLEMKKDCLPFLNDKMGQYISHITKGKYKDLRADDRLTLRTQNAENIDMVPVLLLSEGTAEQMYLALRLAMSDLISRQGESLPLLMDEVFAHFDDFRLRDSMRLLNQISDERQIIILTCKYREVEIAREICRNINVIILKD